MALGLDRPEIIFDLIRHLQKLELLPLVSSVGASSAMAAIARSWRDLLARLYLGEPEQVKELLVGSGFPAEMALEVLDGSTFYPLIRLVALEFWQLLEQIAVGKEGDRLTQAMVNIMTPAPHHQTRTGSGWRVDLRLLLMKSAAGAMIPNFDRWMAETKGL